MKLNKIVCRILSEHVADFTKWVATNNEVRLTIPDTCTPTKLMIERALYDSDLIKFQAIYDLDEPNYITYKIRRA